MMSSPSSADSSLLNSPTAVLNSQIDNDETEGRSPVNQREIFGSDSESEESIADQNASTHNNSPGSTQLDPLRVHPTHGKKSREGSSSLESDSEEEKSAIIPHPAAVSPVSSSDESMLGQSKQQSPFKSEKEKVPLCVDQEDKPAVHDEDEDSSEIRIAADFPLIRVDLGREMFLVKMPNFLSVETRPFDQLYYEGELDEDEVLDEEGRTRLKLKVENTIRWRLAKNENGDTVQESNARMVRWSDGSLSLHLGDEIFDVHKMDIQSDFNHLFIREDRGLQGQGAFKTKLSFRPHSTDSFTHRKITLSLADKTNKSQKVKILPVAGGDPETNRLLSVRKEEERLRVSLRRESKQRRLQERQLAASHRHRSSLSSFSGTAAAADDDDSVDDGDPDGVGVSLNAIKRNAKSGLAAAASSRVSRGSISDSDDASISDLSDAPRRKKGRIIDKEDESD